MYLAITLKEVKKLSTYLESCNIFTKVKSLWAKQLSQLLVGLHHQKKKGHQFSKTEYEKTLKKYEQLIAPTINNYNNIYTKPKKNNWHLP